MNRVNCESLLKQFSIQGNKEALRALVEYVKDDTRVSKAHPHRVLYYSVHLALSLVCFISFHFCLHSCLGHLLSVISLFI